MELFVTILNDNLADNQQSFVQAFSTYPNEFQSKLTEEHRKSLEQLFNELHQTEIFQQVSDILASNPKLFSSHLEAKQQQPQINNDDNNPDNSKNTKEFNGISIELITIVILSFPLEPMDEHDQNSSTSSCCSNQKIQSGCCTTTDKTLNTPKENSHSNSNSNGNCNSSSTNTCERILPAAIKSQFKQLRDVIPKDGILAREIQFVSGQLQAIVNYQKDSCCI